jgi:hypothetical protein
MRVVSRGSIAAQEVLIMAGEAAGLRMYGCFLNCRAPQLDVSRGIAATGQWIFLLRWGAPVLAGGEL